MALANWLCTNNSKNMFIKIVHPGGRIELHDRPLPAAEIMLQNPRCCVTYPHVFSQPWAIVPPNTMLMLGQKFYVVPMSTLSKLQRHSLRSSPPPFRQVPPNHTPKYQSVLHEDEPEDKDSTRWSFANKNTPKQSYSCVRKTDEGNHGSNTDSSNLKEGCFLCWLPGNKIKGEIDSVADIRSSMEEPSQLKELSNKRGDGNGRKGMKESPKRKMMKNNLSGTFIDHWQPSLESITEECPC